MITHLYHRGMGWLSPLFKHHITQRIALVIPIIICVGLIRSGLGYESSNFFGLLTGVIAYGIADLMLLGTQARRDRLRQVKAMILEYWALAAGMVLLVAIIVIFLGTRSEPTVSLVKQVLKLVQIFGILGIFSAAFLSFWDDQWVSSMMTRVMIGFTAYAAMLWLIGRVGDDVYLWSKSHPNDVLVGMVALAIVWMIVRFSLKDVSMIRQATGSMSGVGTKLMPATTLHDNRYIAAHEAGHVLVFAALSSLPPDLMLVANDRSNRDGVLGFVSGAFSGHQLEEKTFAELRMLSLLSGKLGESALFGKTTLGSQGDYQVWHNLARSYLENHYRGMFYPDPKNNFEHDQNQAKLEALRAEQLATLASFFELNAVVHKQLADTLLERRTLTRDDLMPFLARVKLLQRFPQPGNGETIGEVATYLEVETARREAETSPLNFSES